MNEAPRQVSSSWIVFSSFFSEKEEVITCVAIKTKSNSISAVRSPASSGVLQALVQEKTFP